MSKERLGEIRQMVNAFDESSFSATLYEFEMDSKALISDFVVLLNHIEKQQAELDSLSMAHDEMHRLIEKDKHFLIKSNIELDRQVKKLKGMRKADIEELGYVDEQLLEAKHKNKRYRDGLEYLLKEAKEHKEKGLSIWHHALISDIESILEGVK